MRTGRQAPGLFRGVTGALAPLFLMAATAAADSVSDPDVPEASVGAAQGIVPVSARIGTSGRYLPRDPAARLRGPGQSAEPVGALVPEDMPGPGATSGFGPLGLPCEVTFTARATQGGAALLRLEAPCAAHSVVSVAHGEVVADYVTSSSGRLETVFPALEEDARFLAVLPDGAEVAASVRVPGATGYERVATMWTGGTALSVHAFEFGATAGAAGHVWRDAPRTGAVAEAGRGGYLLTLGTPGYPGVRQAEVYSFPSGAAVRDGSVRIALGAEVGASSCGTEIRATSLQVGQDLPGQPVALSLRLPDCGSGEDYVLLKNLARDLKIAAR